MGQEEERAQSLQTSTEANDPEPGGQSVKSAQVSIADVRRAETSAEIDELA